MTGIPDIKNMNHKDEKKLYEMMILAFCSDPVLRWSFPEPSVYVHVMPLISRYFGGRSLDHGTAFCLEDHTGMIQILPHGVTPDFDELFKINEEFVPVRVLPDLMAVYEKMEEYHPKSRAWHIAWTAIDPAYQGQGYGSALVRRGLEYCQNSGLPVYLESTSCKSVSFYERHGFKLLGKIQSGDSPPMFPMIRK